MDNLDILGINITQSITALIEEKIARQYSKFSEKWPGLEGGFLQIPRAFFKNENLRPLERLIMASVSEFGPDCFKSNDTIGKDTGISKASVGRLLISLEKKGFIKREYDSQNPKKRMLKVLTNLEHFVQDGEKSMIKEFKFLVEKQARRAAAKCYSESSEFCKARLFFDAREVYCYFCANWEAGLLPRVDGRKAAL